MAASDIKLPQRNAGDSQFDERTVGPAANSLLGFDGTKVPANVTIGAGLALAGNSLSATGGSASLDIEDEGVPVLSATTLNFAGAGVVVTDSGGGVGLVTIGGGGSSYVEVANFAALPPAGSHSGEIYVCVASQGSNWTMNYKPAGFYMSDGVDWNNLSALPEDYFTDNVMTFVDDADPTKKLMFELSGITTGTTRTWTAQDLNGSVALLENNLGAFTATTSAQLRGVISDESGTGAALFQNGALGNATATTLGFSDYALFTDVATPPTPGAGTCLIYAQATAGGISRMIMQTSTGATLAFFRDVVTTVRNQTGSTINKGSVVYVNGSNGTTSTVALARADDADTSADIGLALANIPNNSFGTIQRAGLLSGVDTSAFSQGDTLYLSDSVAGGIVNVKPVFPGIPMRIGTAVTANASGIIDIFIQAYVPQASDIGLQNVTNDAQTKASIVPNTPPASGQILVGNAGGTAYAPVDMSGDATLADTGALTVANDSITLAKMANIDGTAAEVVLGRSTASSGDPELLATTGTRGSAVVLATSPTLVTPVLGTPTSGTLTNCTGLPLAGLVTDAKTGVVGFGWDNRGTALSTGVVEAVKQSPTAGTITAYSIASDGTPTVEFLKTANGTAVPTGANSINTAGVSLSTGTFVRSTTLTDFTTTAITALDIFGLDITVVGGATWITVQLEYTKS